MASTGELTYLGGGAFYHRPIAATLALAGAIELARDIVISLKKL